MAATTVSIEATCPSSCPFKDRGCYAQHHYPGQRMSRLDKAARGVTGDQVILEEVEEIDRLSPRPGQRLRLHVGGEVSSERGARLLAGAAARWQERGGGVVWTYTHRWREIPHDAWAPIVVRASVERADDIELAEARGYPVALTVSRFPRGLKAFDVADTKAIPCPWEVNRSRTCAACELCFDNDRLIAFEAHGQKRREVQQALVQLRRDGAKSRVEETSPSV